MQGPPSIVGSHCPRARSFLRVQSRRLPCRCDFKLIVSSVSSLLLLIVSADPTLAAAEELLQDAHPRDLYACTDYNATEGVNANPQWLTWDATTGQPYLKLPLTDNWSRYGRGSVQETQWQQLLIQAPKVGDRQLQVDLSDFTFSSSSSGSGVEWGVAADCRGTGYSSEMSINLEGTPFMYEPVHSASIGFAATGGVNCSETGQRCTADCGGMCGFCGLGIAGSVTSATLKVVDQCAFDQGVQLWATTTTTASTTSSSSSFLGNTSTASSTTKSTLSFTSSTSATATLSSSTTTSSSSATQTITTHTPTTQTVTSTSETQTLTTTTSIAGWQYYKFSPSKTADESVVGACQAHGISELKLKNCGSIVDMSLADAYQPGQSSSSAALAIDSRWDTEWMDSARQPLVVRFRQRTFADEYSFVTTKTCPPSDPVVWQFHGSQDGSYWVLLDEGRLDEDPPTQISWRPVQTAGYVFTNCTHTSTTTTTVTSTTTSSWSTTVTDTGTTSHTTSWTASLTMTASSSTTLSFTTSTTTSPEGDFVVMINFGACSDHKLFPILDSVACESAARTLALPDSSVKPTATANRPEGCYLWRGFTGNELWLGINPTNKGRGVETSEANQTRLPVCSSNKLGGDSPAGIATSSGSAPNLRYRALSGAFLASVLLLAML